MGIYLQLVLPGKERTNEQIIDEYYDHVASKERQYFPDDAEEELAANDRRETRRIDFEEEHSVFLYEQIYTNIRRSVDLHLCEVFDSSPSSSELDRVVYGEDIERLIDRLREGKEQMKRQEDEDRWEQTFELQTIALCEFALKNDYGIELT